MGTTVFAITSVDVRRFHSINVPSEWGRTSPGVFVFEQLVSIQLMSPASGDSKVNVPLSSSLIMFPFN